MLLAGLPGAGKSTLLIEVAYGLAKTKKVLYVAGEESPEQIKSRADRLAINSESIYLLGDTEVENIVKSIEEIKPDVAIIDSLQMLHSSNIKAIPGSPSQIRSGLLALNKMAKNMGITIVFVGHSTKGGYVAGLMTFQHTVDAVLYLGLNEDGTRFIKVNKNRFGQDHISQTLYMTKWGLSDDPFPKQPFGANVTTTFTSSKAIGLASGFFSQTMISTAVEWLRQESQKRGLLKSGESLTISEDQAKELAKDSIIMRPIVNYAYKYLSRHECQ
jgi:predicted ATP-dependent serine protease